MKRKRVFTNTVWEKQVAYCRAICAGNHIKEHHQGAKYTKEAPGKR
jgi:hypothetical protein